jgi:hypothetical protein
MIVGSSGSRCRNPNQSEQGQRAPANPHLGFRLPNDQTFVADHKPPPSTDRKSRRRPAPIFSGIPD